MNQDLPGMGIFKSIIMASWVIPVAATVTMFKFMAQPDIGLYNIFFRLIGLDLNRYWLGDPDVAFALIVMLHLWRNVPFYGVAFLAAMQAIPKSYLRGRRDRRGQRAAALFQHHPARHPQHDRGHGDHPRAVDVQ